MWTAIKSSYASGWRFAIALPLLFLIPVLVEFAQHVVEYRIGMFDSLEAAAAVEKDPARMNAGYVKVAALMLMGLWVPRFLASGGDGRLTARTGPRTLGAFALVIAVSLAVMAVDQLVVQPRLAAAGLEGLVFVGALLGVMAVSMMIEVLLAGWKNGAVIGDRRLTFLSSIRRGTPLVLWGLALGLIVILPPMVLHYALNMGMIVTDGAMMWGLIVADSVLVGYMAIALLAPGYFVYVRGLARSGQTPAQPV